MSSLIEFDHITPTQQQPVVQEKRPTVDAIEITGPLILLAFEGKFPDIVLDKRVKRAIEDINRMDMGSLNKITESMALIVQDGVLDDRDIPRIIELANFTFTLISSKTSSFRKKNRTEQIHVCANLIRYLAKLYIFHGDVNIKDEHKAAFFAKVDVLIDSCVSLMLAIVTPSFLRRLFSCCCCGGCSCIRRPSHKRKK